METTFISSAEKIFHNPDLLIEILLRLPTKDLLKFKFVSKHWLSIISDPRFCLRHTRFHQTNGFLSPTAFVLKFGVSQYDVLPLKDNSRTPFFDFLYGTFGFDIFQSCYGLFLCKSSRSNLESKYIICNPVTLKFKELSFPVRTSRDSSFYVSMAFDPLKSSHYKVVCVRKVADQPRPRYYTLDVYSSETDSWSVSRISFPIDPEMRFEGAVFCNGKIHWSSCGSDSLYFDVESESLEPYPMPISTTEPPIDRIYFGEFRGVLNASVTYFNTMCSEMDVFEMASDYTHWTMKHRLYIGDITKNFPEIRRNSRLCSPVPPFSDVWIIQFEKDEEPKVVVWVENKVIFFDSNDETWKSLHDLRVSSSRFRYNYGRLDAYAYFENLSCV